MCVSTVTVYFRIRSLCAAGVVTDYCFKDYLFDNLLDCTIYLITAWNGYCGKRRYLWSESARA